MVSVPSHVESMAWISTHHPDIPVNRGYPLVRILLEQFACHQLLQRKHYAILASYADCCAAVLYCFDCVLDLEVASVGREDRVGKIVACTYRGLCMRLDTSPSHCVLLDDSLTMAAV